MRRIIVVLLLLACASAHAVTKQCPDAKENPLPLPHTIAPKDFAAYEKRIFDFLDNAEYATLGWCVDKRIRDTGPFLNNTSYGTHKSVRIYYSPGVMEWLTGQRPTVPDRAMIVKEQFDAPAAQYLDKPPSSPNRDWTIMIKDSQGSHDGWFWGEFFTGMTFDDHQYPYAYPNAGFGLYCLRCHASAQREVTFASLSNIKGFPGTPLTFRVDDSWRNPPALRSARRRKVQSHAPAEAEELPPPPGEEPDELFLRTFPQLKPVPTNAVQHIPNETYDDVVPPAGGKPQMFLTSNQCQGCHSAATTPFGPTMFLPIGSPTKGINVSEYTEWRWSPMGLGGRDPIFYAQLDSELSYLRTVKPEKTSQELQTQVTDTCFRCHGVLGRRQQEIDDPHGHFTEHLPFETSGPNARFAALARDGVSCTSCHHIDRTKTPPGANELQYFLTHTITGLFPTGEANQLFGPFEDKEIVTLPMNHSLNSDPKGNDYTKSSRLCGTCHTIDLPVVDKPPVEPISPKTEHSIEQATYLEWLNSAYQNELGKSGSDPKSCQDCHMPGSFTSASRKIDVPQLQTRIAIIEDDTYPAAEHILPFDDILVRFRKTGFARHELLGMNNFLLEMFSQFDDVLGVRKTDYMTGATDVLPNVQANLVQQAQSKTATVAVEMKPGAECEGANLTAEVTVTNLTGHRLPSGVGFRRLFLEVNAVQTIDGRERVVWSSGHSNEVGVIVDADGNALPTEFFTDGKFQDHHETIRSQDQVQIYEELTTDVDGKFTTSFIRRDHEVKDNRLLPLGYTFEGPDPKSLNGRYLEATHPKGAAAKDPDYQNDKGRDRVTYCITLPAGVDPSTVMVTATLWYQSIPPYYLRDRFTIGTGPATQRLYFIASNLDLEGTPLEGWKMQIASATRPASGTP